MSDFILVCDSNIRYPMTANERDRYQKKRGMGGRLFPFFTFDNGDEVFMNKVIGIEVGEYNKPKVLLDVESPVIQIKDIPKLDKAPTTEQEVARKKKEAEDELMKDMYEKSNCKHDDVSLFAQDTKKGKRYFPVCDFCGHRGRYVKTENLTDEEKEAAQVWVER